MKTAQLSVDDMPDLTVTLHDDDSIELTITGLAGLEERPTMVPLRRNGEIVTTPTLDVNGDPVIGDDGTPKTHAVLVPDPAAAAHRMIGILSYNPPRIRTKDRRYIELLMLRAIEGALPKGTLDNAEGVSAALDKEQLLLSHVVRWCRRAIWTVEPPQ